MRTVHEFLCTDCGLMKAHVNEHGHGGTGYAVVENDFKICYECCGKRDEKELKEMQIGSKICLYLANGLITNWPGTLKIQPHYRRKGRHNFAGTKTSFWFSFHGQNFYGFQIGNFNQVAHIRKIK